jgi:hypothetical protein
MGEFGRTPRIGKQGGHDHYPRAWTSVLASAGVKGGRAIGRTDKEGGTVEDRPVSAVDFMAAVCHARGRRSPGYASTLHPGSGGRAYPPPSITARPRHFSATRHLLSCPKRKILSTGAGDTAAAAKLHALEC